MKNSMKICPANGITVYTTLILLFCFKFLPLSAQYQTYFGGGISLAAATTLNDQNIFHITKGYLLDGGGYDLTIRQEINNFLSIETGISSFIINQHMTFRNSNLGLPGWLTHRIPLKAEMEVDLVKNRIALYGSAGIHICIRDRSGRGTSKIYLPEGAMLISDNYIKNGWFHTRYNTGTGLRFRLFDEFYFELETGYSSKLNDLVAYDMTWQSTSGEEISLRYEDPLDYWYIQGGISYSIQRVIKGIRYLAEVIESQEIIVVE